jgi:Lamin Tail Domain
MKVLATTFGLLFAALAEAQILINEVDSDTPGSDTAEFVELVNAGVSDVSLSGLSLVFYNGAGDISYFALDLNPAITLGPGAFYVIGNPGVPNVAQTFDPGTSGFLQNGADAVALYNAPATLFPNNTPVTAINLLDAVVYETDDPNDLGLLNVLTPGEEEIDETDGGSSATMSIGRFPNGSGGARQTGTYASLIPTPGSINVIPEPTAIHAIVSGAAVLTALRRRRG